MEKKITKELNVLQRLQDRLHKQRLKVVLMTIRLDALDKRSRHEGLNTNETLHTINNALKPQESEVSNG